jgi:hypothetical protein
MVAAPESTVTEVEHTTRATINLDQSVEGPLVCNGSWDNLSDYDPREPLVLAVHLREALLESLLLVLRSIQILSN